VRTDKSRIGFSVTWGCTESTVLMLTYVSLGLSPDPDEIHSVEMPLAVPVSLTIRSTSDRGDGDDRRVDHRPAEVGVCGGRPAGGAGNAGIRVRGTRGDEGALRDGLRLSGTLESRVLANGLLIGFRWNIAASEFRRPLAPSEVLTSLSGGLRRIRGRGSVSGAASGSRGGTNADIGPLCRCSLMATMASPVGKTVDGSLRTRVGARPTLWTTVT